MGFWENILKKPLTRRQVIEKGALAGVVAAIPGVTVEARQVEVEMIPTSRLSQKELDAHRDAAIKSLVDGISRHANVMRHILSSFYPGSRTEEDLSRKLQEESRMRVPQSEECARVMRQNTTKLLELAGSIEDGRHGLFLQGNTQTLYVLKRTGRTVSFVKAYSVSTAGRGFGNQLKSGKTPLGMHGLTAAKEGLLGEVLKWDDLNSKLLVNIQLAGGAWKTFVRGLTKGNRDRIPTVVTNSFMLVSRSGAKESPGTTTERGILFHGTNWGDGLGEPRSGGCIRMSNVDVRDLKRYIDVGHLRGDSEVFGGTPVMIHLATQEEMIMGKGDQASPEKKTEPQKELMAKNMSRVSGKGAEIGFDFDGMGKKP